MKPLLYVCSIFMWYCFLYCQVQLSWSGSNLCIIFMWYYLLYCSRRFWAENALCVAIFLKKRFLKHSHLALLFFFLFPLFGNHIKFATISSLGYFGTQPQSFEKAQVKISTEWYDISSSTSNLNATVLLSCRIPGIPERPLENRLLSADLTTFPILAIRFSPKNKTEKSRRRQIGNKNK